MSTPQGTGMWKLGLGCALLLAGTATGCRATVQKVQMERVDQELGGGGNRGFFVGNAPAVGSRRDTREIAELQVQLPDGTRSTAARSTTAPAPMDMPVAVTETYTPTDSTTATETYTVKKGDTLWSIAKRFYGQGNQWSRVFDANRDQLAEPGRLRPGMRLRIPGAGASSAAAPATYGK